MEHNELKPPEIKSCPFCGVTPRRVILSKKTYCQLHGDPSQGIIVRCENQQCPARPAVETGDAYNGGREKAEAEAIAAWNTRTDPVRQALVEAINDLLFVIEIPRHWGPSQMDAFRDAEAKVQAALDLARK